MQHRKNRVSGVFRHLFNSAAFIDAVWLQVWGVKRQQIGTHLVPEHNRAIGGTGRAYARCITGRNKVTGNRLQFRYGTMNPYKALSPFSLTIWSHRTPVTCADVMLATAGLMCRRAQIRISRLEVTFDTTGSLLDDFVEELCTSARNFREFGSGCSRTIYVGGVNSAWRLKIYDKTDQIVRTEFTFGRRYLEPRGINQPCDVALIRRTNIWSSASFRVVDETHGDELPRRIRNRWEALGHGLPPRDLPVEIVIKSLREARVDPARWVVDSPRQQILRGMLRNLIW